MADTNNAEPPAGHEAADRPFNRGGGHIEYVVVVQERRPPSLVVADDIVYGLEQYEVELLMLRIHWHFITKDYGPNLQPDNVDCVHEAIDWHGEVAQFQHKWGVPNLPRDIEEAVVVIGAEIFGNVRPVTP